MLYHFRSLSKVYFFDYAKVAKQTAKQHKVRALHIQVKQQNHFCQQNSISVTEFFTILMFHFYRTTSKLKKKKKHCQTWRFRVTASCSTQMMPKKYFSLTKLHQ